MDGGAYFAVGRGPGQHAGGIGVRPEVQQSPNSGLLPCMRGDGERIARVISMNIARGVGRQPLDRIHIPQAAPRPSKRPAVTRSGNASKGCLDRAACTGARSLRLRASGSAPRSRHSSTRDLHPTSAATCRAVLPSASVARMASGSDRRPSTTPIVGPNGCT